MANQSKRELKVAHAKPQEALPPASVSLRELTEQRHRYTIRPSYQREHVWNLRQNQQCVETVLLGDPIPPVEGYEHFDENGVKLWEISDGQNRTNALISFRLGEFKTWTAAQKRAYEPNSQVGPVQPDRYFDELDIIARNYYDDYYLRIDRLRDRPESEKATRFLRVQNHVPLTAAEKLRVYTSKAKDAAECISKHSFWEDFYEGGTNRGQLFQSSLHLLALEMSQSGIADLQPKGHMAGLIAGRLDDTITDALINGILERLDIVSTIYAGSHFTIRGVIIAMYQSVIFLEQVGYDVQMSDKGKLTPWMDGVIADARRSIGAPAYNRPLQSLTGAAKQRDFWNRHIKTVMAYFGVNVSTLGQIPIKKSSQMVIF